jgi:hypothetical protein
MRKTIYIAAALAMFATLFSFSPASAAGTTCKQIDDWAIAQIMLSRGHYQLDVDRNGYACEEWAPKTKAKGEPKKRDKGQGLASYRRTFHMTANPNIYYAYSVKMATLDVFAPVASRSPQIVGALQLVNSLTTTSNAGCVRTRLLDYIKVQDANGDTAREVVSLFGRAEKSAKKAPGVADIVKAYMKVGGAAAKEAAKVVDTKVALNALTAMSYC